MVVLTNNHVISGATNVTVTFTDGITLAANVIGSNANTDFAILSTVTSISRYKPLEIISSSSVKSATPLESWDALRLGWLNE